MGQCVSSQEAKNRFTNAPMPDPLSVYVPLASLTEAVIRSVCSTVLNFERPDWNHSRRTLLAFLLALNERLNDVDKNKDKDNQLDEDTLRHVEEIRQWLVKEDKFGQRVPLDWDRLRAVYQDMVNDKTGRTRRNNGGDIEIEPYYELNLEVVS